MGREQGALQCGDFISAQRLEAKRRILCTGGNLRSHSDGYGFGTKREFWSKDQREDKKK
jgi:hypothetical protein